MTYPIDTQSSPGVEPFFDNESNTFSYIVTDTATKACAIVDPVLGLDYASGRLGNNAADRLIAHIESEKLELAWIIETHVHADHLSAAPYLQDRLGGKIGIGEKVTLIQESFGKVFNEGTEFERDGSQFDHLFRDGDTYQIGGLTGFAIDTPGHTPACMVHIIGNTAFVGDTLFMPDGGSARADFPGGDSGQLYDSIQKVLSLPGETRIFVCHDYGPNGRQVMCETTVDEQRERNIHVGTGTDKASFVRLRDERDATLAMPRLIIPSLQVNMRAGQIPCDDGGNPTLKVPLNSL